MSDNIVQASLENAVAVGCGACGARFRARRWREGLECPKCHSGQVQPLIAPGGAVDYIVADRSGGYAPADMRFAQWAKWCEVITPSQYELAFIKQNRQIQDGIPPEPVHEILVREGFMDRKAAARLLEFMSRPRPDEDDGAFAAAVVAAGKADRAKVEAVARLQLKAATRYHEVPPLCQLLMERRLISEGEMLAVLRLQQQDGCGVLKVAQDLVAGPQKERSAVRLREVLSPRNRLLRQVALVVVLFATGLAMWLHQFSEDTVTMVVQCAVCRTFDVVPWSTEFPVECPRCGTAEARYAVICRNSHAFVVDNPFRSVPCPECGTIRVRAIKEEDIENGQLR